jgi:hypothetical protein
LFAQMMGAAENAELGGLHDEEEMVAGTAPPPPRKMQSLDFEHIGSLAAVAESLSPRSKWRMALRSVRIVIFQAKINVLLPFGPLAITLHYIPGNHVRKEHAHHQITPLPIRFQHPSLSTMNAFFHFLAFLLTFSCKSKTDFPFLRLLPSNASQQGWVFLFSLIGITPLAERLGYATE